MTQYYFTFNSLTQAQTALHRIRRRGIDAQLKRTPTELAVRGCGYSVAVEERAAHSAAAALTAAAIAYRGLYREMGGSMQEVIL